MSIFDSRALFEITSNIDSVSFCWFGTDRSRYIEVDLKSTLGYDHDERKSWESSACTVKLKELGSDSVTELLLTSKNDASLWGEDIANYRGAYYWSDDDVETILDWLKIPEEVDLSMFRKLMPAKTPPLASLSTVGRYGEYKNVAWNGQITSKEVARLTKLFLNNENEWAKEIEFAANRMKTKLILLNRAKV